MFNAFPKLQPHRGQLNSSPLKNYCVSKGIKKHNAITSKWLLLGCEYGLKIKQVYPHYRPVPFTNSKTFLKQHILWGKCVKYAISFYSKISSECNVSHSFQAHQICRKYRFVEQDSSTCFTTWIVQWNTLMSTYTHTQTHTFIPLPATHIHVHSNITTNNCWWKTFSWFK